MTTFPRSHPGFTIVELAIVLVIIGLVLTTGMVTVTALMDAAANAQVKSQLEQFKTTIFGFATRTQRLPNYKGTAAIDDEITPNMASITDYWGQRLVYLYEPELARLDIQSPICAKRTTNIAVRNCPDTTCATYADTQNVALVFFSSGKSLSNQTDAADSAVARTEPAPYASFSGPVGSFGAANQKIIKIYTPGNQLGPYSAPTTNLAAYDDQVVIITLDELRQRVGCSVKPLKLINIDLPMGAQGASYSVDVIAEGGVPIDATHNYRWCIESSDPSLEADLAFQVRDRYGIDYPTALTATKQVFNSCIAATTIETGAAWVTGDLLRIVGASSNLLAPTGGARTRSIKVFVRDNQNAETPMTVQDTKDNIESRAFVVPINGN